MSTTAPFKDHFSRQAGIYARFRPTYPALLFAHLVTLAPGRSLAWDAGTGNGQAALSLCDHFDLVTATDPSEQQIKQAIQHERIIYRIEKAEATEFAESSVDLLTIANALQWLDLPVFYEEVKRVMKPGGIIAAWCYRLPSISPPIDKMVGYFHKETLGECRLPENLAAEQGYRNLEFPFAEIEMPPFFCERSFDLQEFIGYLNTLSAVQRFILKNKFNPTEDLSRALQRLWKDPAEKKTVKWELLFRVGKKS